VCHVPHWRCLNENKSIKAFLSNSNQKKSRGRKVTKLSSTMKNIFPHFEGHHVLSFSRLSHLCLPPHSDQTVPCNILYYEQMFDRLATFANKVCKRGMSNQSQTDSVTYLISVLDRARHNFSTNRLISEPTLMYVCCTKLFDR